MPRCSPRTAQGTDGVAMAYLASFSGGAALWIRRRSGAGAEREAFGGEVETGCCAALPKWRASVAVPTWPRTCTTRKRAASLESEVLDFEMSRRRLVTSADVWARS